MNKKLLKLAKRREYLVAKAENQRMQLAQAVDVWRVPLALADQGLAALSFIKKHPILVAGGSAVLVRLLRKSFIGKWFSRGLFALQIVRKLKNRFSF
jgi:YqjK-like protein